MPSLSPWAGWKRIGELEEPLGDLLEHQLGDPVTHTDGEGLPRVEVDEVDEDLAAVAESTVPGALTTEMPWRAASPERGCTSPTQPCGIARLTPVGTSARSPDARVTSATEVRSAPASPCWA